MSERRPWILDFCHAICSDCGWEFRSHVATEPVLRLAREHNRLTGHYVQVERGQVLHYHEKEPPS